VIKELEAIEESRGLHGFRGWLKKGMERLLTLFQIPKPVAAVVAVTLVVTVVWFSVDHLLQLQYVDESHTYQTEIGEQRKIVLSDGSTVILDTASRISTKGGYPLRSR
jgi:ferric-dicitrate binding protein FerR (iron transport regulator)